LSSITEPRSERGQILIIFAGSLLVIFGIAALVFDGGLMLLEKRAQQNAADAAAIAGARFLPGNQGLATTEAQRVATANGFTHGVDHQIVTITFPSATRIRVQIHDQTPSFFAGIWGMVSHDVGSSAVAINGTRPLGPFALLSLNPTDCAAMDISGKAILSSDGDIQVNSECDTPGRAAWELQGNGEIVVADGVACRVVGGFAQKGVSSKLGDCKPEVGAVHVPDPFLGLEPYEPSPTDSSGQYLMPDPIEPLVAGTKGIPAGCPGSAKPATHEEPNICRFPNSNDYKSTIWRMYPGYYPGGLHLLGGTFYLEPGIYFIGGGGFQANGQDATVMSVATGGTDFGGGVLIFNSTHPTEKAGDVRLTGGNAGVRLLPLQTGTWSGMVIYQDVDVCLPVLLAGDASTMEVRGAIYVPCGTVTVLGNGGTIVTDQIVADKFMMSGNAGTLRVVFDGNNLPGVRLAGLIE
jgi:hypothetical protein